MLSINIHLLEARLSLQCAPYAASLLRRINPPRRRHIITLNDCKAFCDADPETVTRVARHERLPEILAIACAQSRVSKARRLNARQPILPVSVAALTQRLAA
ncbi:MAG: hypothetical protein IPH41_08430 [Sulfuritalea sp.]|nr:hypothetical protein [Sulfuritalea sp.]